MTAEEKLDLWKKVVVAVAGGYSAWSGDGSEDINPTAVADYSILAADEVIRRIETREKEKEKTK